MYEEDEERRMIRMRNQYERMLHFENQYRGMLTREAARRGRQRWINWVVCAIYGTVTCLYWFMFTTGVEGWSLSTAIIWTLLTGLFGGLIAFEQKNYNSSKRDIAESTGRIDMMLEKARQDGITWDKPEEKFAA